MSRLQTITEKVDREKTGLAGSLFVHVDFNAAGAVDAVRFSEKGKDLSTIDNILVALGDATTDIIARTAIAEPMRDEPRGVEYVEYTYADGRTEMIRYVRADIADGPLTVCHAIVDMADEYTNIAVLRAAKAAIAKTEEAT